MRCKNPITCSKPSLNRCKHFHCQHTHTDTHTHTDVEILAFHCRCVWLVQILEKNTRGCWCGQIRTLPYIKNTFTINHLSRVRFSTTHNNNVQAFLDPLKAVKHIRWICIWLMEIFIEGWSVWCIAIQPIRFAPAVSHISACLRSNPLLAICIVNLSKAY